MKSIFMNQNPNDITPTPVENGQQSDSVPHDVANQLAAVQSQIKMAIDLSLIHI